MRRITVVGMIILGLVAMPLVVAAKPPPKDKVEICHFTGDGVQDSVRKIMSFFVRMLRKSVSSYLVWDSPLQFHAITLTPPVDLSYSAFTGSPSI